MNFADYKHKDPSYRRKHMHQLMYFLLILFFLVYGAWRLPIRNMRKKLKIIEQEQM